MTKKELILKKLEILKEKKHELEDISAQQDTTQHALKIFLKN